MEIKRCFICMYKGLIKVGTNNDILFKGSEEKHIMLCYSHSVELFKDGQKKFLFKYQDNFAEMDMDTAVFSQNGRRSLWY